MSHTLGDMRNWDQEADLGLKPQVFEFARIFKLARGVRGMALGVPQQCASINSVWGATS